MMRVFVLIAVVFLIACDPGRPENTPLSKGDRSDWFASESLDVLPLDLAIRRDRVAEVRQLLESGTDPNRRWSQTGDRFALREAIDTEGRSAVNLDIVRLLLTHGADPNARWCPFRSRDSWSEWPGHRSCRSASGMTPLIFATIRGQRDIVEMLLQAGAAPDAEDWSRQSALDYANDEVIFELVSRAMFPDLETRDQRALAWLDRHFREPRTPAERTTPLSRALWRDRDRSRNARIVIGLGADPNERTGDGRTPLSMALATSLSLASLLLEHGADPHLRWCERTLQDTQADPACTVDNGITPLMFSARLGSVEAVELLLKYKADKSLRDWAGRTAAHYAKTRETWELTIVQR
jgi:ankyrin repeat protein